MQDILVYLYPLSVIVIAIIPLFKQGEKLSYYSFISVFLLSSILLFIRDPLAATDAGSYEIMYSQAYEFEYIWNAYHGNVFFSFLQWLGQELSLEFGIFMKLHSILCLFLVSCGLFLLIPKRLLALSEGFFVITSTFILLFTNVIRQGLALSLIILAIALYIKKYRKISIFTFLLAVLSHSSAIVIVICFFLSTKYQHSKTKNIVFFKVIPLLPIAGYFMLQILSSLGGWFSKINLYSSHEYNNILAYIKIIHMYIFGLFFYFYTQNYRFKKDLNIIFNLYIYLVALSFFLSPILVISSRFIYYGTGLMPILFTHFYKISWGTNLRYIKLLSFFSLAVIHGFIVISYPNTFNQLGL